MNALKHCLRAKSLVLPGEDEQAYHTRLDAWTAALQPRDEVEDFMVARAVHASWNLQRVDRARAARREAARYADADHLAALAEQVAAWGRRLLWNPNGPPALYPLNDPAHGDFDRPSWSGDPDDPDDPARLVMKLNASALGCAWLLDRFDELREILEDGLLWQPHDRFKAIRLLGRQPIEAIDDQRVMAIYLACWTMEPGTPYGFSDLLPELTAEERTVYFDRLNARAPLGAKPASPEAARAALLALIAEEEERLEGVLAGHLEREEAEAAAEQAFDASAYGERLRGYEAFNERTVLRIIEALRKRQQEADGMARAGGRARREERSDRTAPGLPPGSDPRRAGCLGSEAASAAAAPGGESPAPQAGAPGGGIGRDGRLNPGHPADDLVAPEGMGDAARAGEEPGHHPGWPGSEAALDAAAAGGIAPAPEPGAPGGGAGLTAGWTPATPIPSPPIGADARSASVPADSPLVETARGDKREAYGLTEEEVRYRNARILEVLGCGPEIPSQDMTHGAADLLTSRERERPVLGPGPPQAPPLPGGRGSAERGATPVAPIGADGAGARPAIDPVARTPTDGSNRPVAPACRLAGSVLALFALIGSAGLHEPSRRASARPTSASPGRPIDRILAPRSSLDPTWGGWLCSSRAPDDPVVVLGGGRGSPPVSLYRRSPHSRAGSERDPQRSLSVPL